MAVIGHASLNFPLRDTRFVSEARGNNDVAQSIAGRARALYELLAGTNPFPDEQPATTRNPQRNLGHDHSGPPWGSAFLHPVAWWVGQKAATATLQQPAGLFDDLAESSPKSASFTFWNRPHATLPQPRIAPYSRLFLYIVAHRPTTNAALGVRVESVRADGSVEFETDSITVTGATPAGYVSTAYLRAHGGRNRARIQFTAGDANTPSVTAWALCNVVKRTH